MEFVKEKISTVSGDTHYILTQKNCTTPQPFQIKASRAGMWFEGVSGPMDTREALDSFARAVADAWKEHLKLIPKIEVVKEFH